MTDVVIGIDPSSKKIAFVVTDIKGVLVECTIRHLPDPSPIEVKCDWAENSTRRFIQPYTKRGFNVHVFIEDPLVGRGGVKTTITQSTVRGGILIACRRAGATTIQGVNQSTWKKQVLGKGNYPKDKIPAHIRMTWPKLYELSEGDPDMCDAGCIANYGVGVMKRSNHYKTKGK